MPYIKERRKRAIWSGQDCVNTGELTYLLYVTCLEYCNRIEKPNFQTYAEVIAALDCAKEEFRRRILNPYEDKKIEENGDVNV